MFGRRLAGCSCPINYGVVVVVVVCVVMCGGGGVSWCVVVL